MEKVNDNGFPLKKVKKYEEIVPFKKQQKTENLIQKMETVNIVNYHQTRHSWTTESSGNDEIDVWASAPLRPNDEIIVWMSAPLMQIYLDENRTQLFQERDHFTQCRTESYRCV